MSKISRVAAVVLAGGRSARMGRDKAGIEIAGRPLLEHVVRRARTVFETVMIAGPARLAVAGIRAVPDERPAIGPLEGLRTGFQATGAEWMLALPCDSPFVPEAFLRGMADLAGSADVIVPRPAEFLEPLHAVYSRSCRDRIEQLIAAGERKIILLYDLVQVREVGPQLLGEWDPEGLAFFNINTPADLRRAEQYLSVLKGRD